LYTYIAHTILTVCLISVGQSEQSTSSSNPFKGPVAGIIVTNIVLLFAFIVVYLYWKTVHGNSGCCYNRINC